MRGVATWYERAGTRDAAGAQATQGGFSVPFETKEEAVTSGDGVDVGLAYPVAQAHPSAKPRFQSVQSERCTPGHLGGALAELPTD